VLYEDEDPYEGNVTTETYKFYFKSLFTRVTFSYIIIMLILNESLSISYARSLGVWADDQMNNNTAITFCSILALTTTLFYGIKYISWVFFFLDGSLKLHHTII